MICITCKSEMHEEHIEGISHSFYVCPTCPDTSEHDRREANIAHYMAAAGIPHRILDVLAAGPDEDADNREAMEAGKKYCIEIETHLKDGTGMMIMGTVGAGKSVVSGRMVQYLARKLTLCRWVSFRYFANMIEDNTTDTLAEAAAELYRFERYPVLILDDLCCDVVAPWQKKKLNHLINERHENKKPTIYTTNCNDKDMVTELGAAMWSRISGDCQIVVMSGRDRRQGGK